MRVALLPGQGAQKVGMGADLYKNSKEARDLFEEAEEILDLPLLNIMVADPNDQLKETLYTQLALFVHSFIIFKLLGMTFGAAAGHSLGQFSALAAMGAVTYKEMLLLIKERGSAMGEAAKKPRGTMAAILGLAGDVVNQLCTQVSNQADVGIVNVANYNSPGQATISGTIDAVAVASALASESGARRVVPLAVSGAWHSGLMEPAQARFAFMVGKTNFLMPRVPVYNNVTGEPFTSVGELMTNLVEQLVKPVMWEATICNMARDGATEFWELGSGNVLTGLVKRIIPDAVVHNVGTWEELQKYKAQPSGRS